MQDLSTELTIGKNLTDNLPAMLISLMQDMHHPLPIWCCFLEAKGDHKISILLLQMRNLGRNLKTTL